MRISRLRRSILALIALLLLASTTATRTRPESQEWKLNTSEGLRGANRAALVIPAGRAQVIVELSDSPAAEIFASERRQRQALGGSASEGLANRAAQSQLRKIEAAQLTLLKELAGPAVQATELYRVQRVFNGIAIEVDSSLLKQIAALSGVKAVQPLRPAQPARSFSVPFIGATSLWGGAGLNVTGKNIKVGILDSGIDYIHKDFGGTGDYAGQVYDDAAVPWTAKVVGGYDFAGDDYDPDSADPAKRIPRPDPDPMDCNGHGTSVAGIVAGYGIRRDGSTYSGPYRSLDRLFASFLGPGVAPEAQLYALKVDGCQGTTWLIPKAIEWAADPNGDGDFSDHLDVLNISMAGPWGDPDEASARALENAALVGVLSAAGAANDGDTFYIIGAPSVASHAISVAGSETGNFYADGFRVNAPASLQGVYPSSNSSSFDWRSLPGPVSGNVIYPSGAGQNTGCSAFNAENAALIRGNIALVDWSDDCKSGPRVGNAAQAGARGMLIIDSQTGLFGISGGVQIPATLITQDVGARIKQSLAPALRSMSR